MTDVSWSVRCLAAAIGLVVVAVLLLVLVDGRTPVQSTLASIPDRRAFVVAGRHVIAACGSGDGWVSVDRDGLPSSVCPRPSFASVSSSCVGFTYGGGLGHWGLVVTKEDKPSQDLLDWYRRMGNPLSPLEPGLWLWVGG